MDAQAGAEATLEHLNHAHGTSYRLVRKFATGSHGAYEVLAPDGARAVFKLASHASWLNQLRQAVPTIEQARARGE